MAVAAEIGYRNAVAFTITLNGLTNGSARRSAAIDWKSIKDLNKGVFVQINTATSGTSATGRVDVYWYGAIYDGTTTLYETTGSSDAAYTLRGGDRYLGSFDATANDTIYNHLWEMSEFGIWVPPSFGIIVANNTGATLPTDSDNLAQYQGLGLAA